MDAEPPEIGGFTERWFDTMRHDLAASDSQTIGMAELLALAGPEDRARWHHLALGYTDPRGAAWLRASIAASYDTIGPDSVLCFAGAQEALACAARALLGPQDHAVVVVPIYQPSEIAVTSCCAATGVALDPAQGWALDLDKVAAAIRPNSRIVLANFPNNPTGGVIGHDTLDGLVRLCRRHGLWLVQDEVYRLIDRDPARRLPQVADIYERGVSLNALSKVYGLPGLRAGWMACPDPHVLDRAASLKHLVSGCLAAPTEVLANVALQAAPTLLARTRRIAADNLPLLEAFFARHPALFDWTTPDAGVVGFPRYLGGHGVEAFAAGLAHAAGGFVLPASVFRSALASVPQDRFRIGFGRAGMMTGLAALEAYVGTQGQALPLTPAN